MIEGLNGIAGEWGHNVLDPNGHQCYCGRKGCVETVLSGPSIERSHLENFGTVLSLPEIAKRAASGDPECSETLDRTCDWLGRALSVVVNILDPSIIVLGGGVSSLDVLYTKGLESLRSHSFHDSLKTNLVRARMGDSAGVLGAALLTI